MNRLHAVRTPAPCTRPSLRPRIHPRIRLRVRPGIRPRRKPAPATLLAALFTTTSALLATVQPDAGATTPPPDPSPVSMTPLGAPPTPADGLPALALTPLPDTGTGTGTGAGSAPDRPAVVTATHPQSAPVARMIARVRRPAAARANGRHLMPAPTSTAAPLPSPTRVPVPGANAQPPSAPGIALNPDSTGTISAGGARPPSEPAVGAPPPEGGGPLSLPRAGTPHPAAERPPSTPEAPSALTSGIAETTQQVTGVAQAVLPEMPASTRLRQAFAEGLLRTSGIRWRSTGHCSDRRRRTCTSFDGLRWGTLRGVIEFRAASRCPVTITGGTERGHAGGPRSHGTGYKLDIATSRCVDAAIRRYPFRGVRGDGARLYRSPDGTLFAREKDHWDITFA